MASCLPVADPRAKQARGAPALATEQVLAALSVGRNRRSLPLSSALFYSATVGILCMLAIITLRNQVAGPDESTVAYTLAAIKDWTFLLGPGWVVGWGNGLILGYLMYSSGLVPPRAAWLGLIGGPLIIVSGTVIMFTGNDPSNALHSLHSLHSLQAIVTIPEFAWELFLGVYCTIWGFRRDARSFPGAPNDDPAEPTPHTPDAALDETVGLGLDRSSAGRGVATARPGGY